MSKSSHTVPRFVKIVSPLAIAIALTACGGGGSTFGGGESSGGSTTTQGEKPTVPVSSIELRASSPQLLSDGSLPIEITAIAKDQSNIIIDNADLVFSVDKTATLAVNGSSAILTPNGSTGIVTITAMTLEGDIVETMQVEIVDEISESDPEKIVTSIEIEADSLQLLSDGSEPVTISAISKNSSNNAITDAGVSFSVDKNATLIRSGNSVQVKPNGSSGTLTITVVSGVVTETLKIEVVDSVEEVDPAKVVASIEIRSDSEQLLADGSAPVTLTAIAKNASNNQITDAPFTFSVTDPATLAVNGNKATLTPNGATGILTVTITSGGISQTKRIEVVDTIEEVDPAKVVASIEIRSDSEQLLADGSAPVTLTAIAKNASNNQITDAPFTFSVTDPATLAVNGNKATLTPNGATGILTVTITSGGISQTKRIEVVDAIEEVDPAKVVASIEIRSDSEQLLADGSAPVTLTAIAKNASNNQITDAPFTFSVTDPATLAVNGNKATLTPNGATGILTVTITSGGISQTKRIEVVDTIEEVDPAKVVASIELEADSTQLLSDGSAPAIISAIPKNSSNNAISDAVVEFSVDKQATLVVNGNSVQVRPNGSTGTLTITATSGDVTNTIQIEVVDTIEEVDPAKVVASIDMQSESSEILADGSLPVKITAIAKNDQNTVITDAPFTFSVTDPATLVVNGNKATLTPNGATGTLTVTATSGEISQPITIEVVDSLTQAESAIKIGALDGVNFREGELEIADTDLAAGGKTTIKVSLVDSKNNNELYAEPTTVTFNSSCIANNLASISDVVFNVGVATVTYEAKGCSGLDTVTATAIVDGKTIKASSDITVEAAKVGSIAFDSAEPANIGLKGMGLDEVSTVTFTVLDVEGNPVINQDVNFSLSTETGGITLTSTTAKTDANGKVSTKVHSGTKATTVKVRASVTADGTEYVTESRGLVISTGVADQNSFSLSVDTFNPEAFGYDGEEVNLTVRAADHYNNPVPDNTAISFTAEAGSVSPFCLTTNGACSVKWTSSGDRPVDGRATILAFMQGEESFVDSNGNGLLDDGESFGDLPETFRDDNFDGIFNGAGTGGTDELKDFNQNGNHDSGDGEFNGLLCNPANTVNVCSSQKNVFVSDSIELVMSGSQALINAPDTLEIFQNSTGSFSFDLTDQNGQSLPAGTSVAVSIATSGAEEEPHTILSETAFTVSNTNSASPAFYPVIIKDEGTGLSSVLKITVTTPKSHVTTAYVNLIEKGTQQEPELAEFIDLSASASQILSDGTQPVVITAIAKDINNNVLPGITAEFSVDDDNNDGIKHGTLNVSGNTATLTPGGATSGEKLIVTATITKSTGDIVKTVAIDVVDVLQESQADSLELSASTRQLFSDGSSPVVLSAIVKDSNNNPIDSETVIFSVDNNATISPLESSGAVKTAELTPGLNHPENRILTVTATVGSLQQILQVEVVGTHLSVEGPASIAINKPTEYTFKLQDSGDKPIAYKDITVTSSQGHTVTPVGGTAFTTDANGELTVTLEATSGGTDTLTASAMGATVAQNVEISGNDFTLASTNSDIDLGTPETITVEWLQDTLPKVGETIAIRTTRGTLSASSVVTNASGQATFDISSNAAGSATITAETSSGLTTTLNREFVATTPEYLSTQASPSLIAPNGTSTVITKVRDANDNPVKGVKVNFNLTDAINGALSNSLAVTDSLGRAEVVYTAGDSSSSLDGVKINTYLQDYPTITDLVTLTVGSDALRIVLGSDETLADSGVFYTKTFGVIVTDSAGNPIKDQKVDFTIKATDYIKGYMYLADIDGDLTPDIWAQEITTLPGSSSCPSEDLDNDGQLDIGEDDNGNSKLDPTQAATVTGTATTDDQGKLTVQVVYPQSEALWSTQRLTATTLVDGTEIVENTTFTLPMTAEDFKKVDQGLPNQVSPYGTAAVCTDAN